MQLILELLKRPALAAAPKPETEVLPHAQVGVEGIALKHHGHIPLGRPQLRNRLIADPDLSFSRSIQAREQPQQGAFAAARWAHQHEELPILNAEIKLADYIHRGAAPTAWEGFAQPFKANARHS